MTDGVTVMNTLNTGVPEGITESKEHEFFFFLGSKYRERLTQWWLEVREEQRKW